MGLKSLEAETKGAGEEVAVAKPVNSTCEADVVALNFAAAVPEVVVEEVGMRNPVEVVEGEQYRHIGEEAAAAVGVDNGNWKAVVSNFEETKKELLLALVVMIEEGVFVGSFDCTDWASVAAAVAADEEEGFGEVAERMRIVKGTACRRP